MRTISDRWVQANGVRLHVTDFGEESGPLLLFVHGTFGHGRVWDFVIRHLPEDLRVAAMDLPGHGESGHAESAARYAMAALVDDVKAVLGEYERPAVLAGHSFGGALAMRFAGTHPEAVDACVLMDIEALLPQRHAEHLHEVGSRPAKAYADMAGAIEREARTAPNASREIWTHIAEQGYRKVDGQWNQKFDQRFLQQVEPWDTRPFLPRIAVPALVLRGGESTVMSDAGFQLQVGSIPGARGEVIPGASHQLHLDRPAEVAAAITVFVRECFPRTLP